MGALTKASPMWRRRAIQITTLAVISAGAAASPALAQPPPATPDDFVAAVAGANRYELMAARLALVESKDARIQAFAKTMLHDHSAALDALGDAARRSSLKPPPQSVGDGGTQLLAALQGLRGAEFDRTYVRQQVLAHAQATANEAAYLKHGSDSHLRALAKADLVMIAHHAQAARDLQVE